MSTVADLGARALRKLGVSVVAFSAQPAIGPVATSGDVVTEVLRNLGIFGSEAALSGLGSFLTFTSAQIATKVLLKLAVIASDETPLPQDQALALDKTLAVHDELLALGLVPWGANYIPSSMVEYYVIMAAHLTAPEFGRVTTLDELNDAREIIRRMGVVRGATSRALQAVNSVHSELQGLGLVTWTVDTIPGSMLNAYAAAATALMGEETGKPVDGETYASQMMRVRSLAMGGSAGQALAEAKVRAVHYLLDARGRTRWTLYDIPDYAEEPYVFMAATWLAPELGVKADPAWWPQAEMNLNRIIGIPSSHRPVAVDYF